MPSTVERGPITTRVKLELEVPGFPVGDNAAPEAAHGWSGQPNDTGSVFTPWLTLTPSTAVAQAPSGALGDTGTEWRLNYNVFFAGVSRKQTEALADRVRAALVDIRRELVTGKIGNWKIQKISCTSVGSNNRVGSAYPDYFTQNDAFEVWVTKGTP